jgi:hypothetical protein
MEIFPYMLSVLLVALAIYWSGGNTTRKPGGPMSNLFRYRETRPTASSRRSRTAQAGTVQPGTAASRRP